MTPQQASVSPPPISVLFVCMGNICRSPTAHGVFRHKVAELGLSASVSADSAGTHNFHPNSPPDERSQAHAAKRGYDLSDLRARQIQSADFQKFDLILVMDMENLASMKEECPPAFAHKIRLLTEFCLDHDAAVVPDPYYGGANGFDHVLDLVEDACEGLLVAISYKQIDCWGTTICQGRLNCRANALRRQCLATPPPHGCTSSRKSTSTSASAQTSTANWTHYTCRTPIGMKKHSRKS
jgi:protein-tyrosine phosphatase